MYDQRDFYADGIGHEDRAVERERQRQQQPPDGSAYGHGRSACNADAGERELWNLDSGHDQHSKDVYPDQLPERRADQHRDLDDRRL